MRHLFDRPLGACASNGFLLKCDIYSMIGSVVGAGSQMATNQVNAERAASDMATYLNLVKKSRDWQKEDQRWSADMIRKSVGLQMQGYEDAGLNPYAAVSNGQITSGQSYSPGSRSSVSPMQRPMLENPLQGASDKIFGASAVRSQRIAALAEFAKSLPDLMKGLDKESSKRIASSIFGMDIDNSRIDKMVENEAAMQQYNTEIAKIEANIKTLYGEKEAANVIALQEQSFNKMAAEIGLMSSEGKVNESKINQLASECVRNMADAFKLKKEGAYYVASAAQYKELSNLVHLQAVRLKFQNKSQGFDEGSPLYNVFGQKDYVNKLGEAYELHADRAASSVEYFLNKWLGEYLKVSGNVTPSGGTTVNYNY